MKKPVTTLGMLTGFGLAATLFLGCQDFVGGKEDGAPVVQTAEDGAAGQPGVTELTADPFPIGEATQTSPQASATLSTDRPPVPEPTESDALPGNVQAAPPETPANPNLESVCNEISLSISAAKGETDTALRDSLYSARMAEWVAMDCNSLLPPPPYISPEQKCLDAKEQMHHTEQNGYGPGTKYYQTWLDEVNKYCGAAP